MTTQALCPSRDQLAELLRGHLDLSRLECLEQHLQSCRSCVETLQRLRGEDTFSDMVREAANQGSEAAEPVVEALVRRILNTHVQPGTATLVSQEGTPRAESSQTQAFSTSPSEDVLPLTFLAPPELPDELGRLGHYRILKVLGKGGMGAVFLADDRQLERQVALKVMLPRLAANPTARDRFLREARAAAKVKSDHIVTIYQVDEVNKVPYLAMELLEGQPLDEALHNGSPLAVPQIVAIARDVARGLAAAHEKGLIHRDIKPGNLWLEGEPGASATGARVKILDFGLARPQQDDVHLTQAGVIVGTPAYMAPEQARGEQSVDARADLFSLGCVLYRLCLGDSPFKSETMMGTLTALATSNPVPPAEQSDSIPAPLSELIMQLLEKNPARRPQTARDVLARLHEIEHSLAPNRRRHTRRPLVRAALGLLFAAVVAAAVFFWQTPDGKVVRIECDDPTIQIAFGDGELKVAGAYKEPLTLKPGKVGLKVRRGDDFEFQTERLVVNRGEKIVLKIEVSDGKVQIVQAGKGVLDERELPGKPVPRNVQAGQPAVVMTLGDVLTAPDYEWLEPKDLGIEVLGMRGHAVTADGLELWFTRGEAAGGEGKEDLWFCRRKALDAPWEAPVNAGPSVNGPGNESQPALSADGLTLIFHHFIAAYSVQESSRASRDAPWSKRVPVTDSSRWRTAAVAADGLEMVTSNYDGSLVRFTRPNRQAKWGNGGAVEDLPARPLWFGSDGRWCLVCEPGQKLPLSKSLWLAQRAAPGERWGEAKSIDVPASFGTLRLPYPLLTPAGLELYFPQADRLHVAYRIPKARAAERRAAEWALSLGGKVAANGRSVEKATELPHGAIRLDAVTFQGVKRVIDADLANLKNLDRLTTLNLEGTSVTDAGLPYLRVLPGLQRLDVRKTKVTAKGLADFHAAVPGCKIEHDDGTLEPKK